MSAGIGEQVGEHLVQPGRITGHGQRFRRHVEQPSVIWRGHMRIAHRFDYQRA
jgi:hypothetical protein